MKDKKELPEAVREYMSELGRKGGMTNKSKGSEYFKLIREGKKGKELPSLPKDSI